MARINAQSKADVDPVFQKQVEALQQAAQAQFTNRLQGNSAGWMMPNKDPGNGKWEGDLYDLENLGIPFSRDKLNQTFVDAAKDEDSPGTVGDMASITMQVDWLAALQRAFVARHTHRPPRTMMLAMGRLRGHGHANGPLIQGVLAHVTGLVGESKNNTTGS